jgi:hypothetical protein
VRPISLHLGFFTLKVGPLEPPWPGLPLVLVGSLLGARLGGFIVPNALRLLATLDHTLPTYGGVDDDAF